jgi:tetratricopeptide (TPR) repeat protein
VTTLSLGPFVLEAVIGRGGMGAVWRAHHADQGVPVAIKVLTTKRARAPEWRDALRDEVAAVARLHHAAIVRVLDVGAVDPAAEAASAGRIVAGSPYLVMELCPEGPLTLRPPRDWAEARGVLLALLDGLAHAHARGVVHRDLKPGNVLRSGATVKLGDFGVAHLGDGDGGKSQAMGTPPYMAPEQFTGTWRDQGPWTDLYALGCFAWELATGTPPFVGDTAALSRAHRTQEIPAFRQGIAVPPTLAAWLARLLEKAPAARFECAADARLALSALGEPTLQPVTRPTSSRPDNTTLLLDAIDTAPVPAHDGAVRAVRPTPSIAPPFPPEPAPEPATAVLLGAGLGLFGVRAVPLVGRDDERAILWRLLGEARGGARTVVVRGPAGCGKTRLVQWLAEQAHESGAAVVVKAVHAGEGGPAHGLARMVVRHVRAVGLGPDAVAGRLAASLVGADPHDVAAITAVATDAADRFAKPAERYVAIERWLAHLAASRPVLVWLEDAQWGPDAIGLARHLARSDLPVLTALTIRDEALADRPLERAAVDELPATVIRLGPLPDHAMSRLVRELLSLEPALATAVADRTGGSPLFAVEIVGGWVKGGGLEPGAGGFRLRPGVVLPDDLHAVWTQRIDAALVGMPASARRVLEVAAVLGVEVALAEWELATVVPSGLLPALIAADLAVRTEEGFAFAHGMLRDSLVRVAREAGRLEAHHAACAAMLAAGDPDPERVGLHRLGAGDVIGAVPALIAATQALYLRSEHARALALVGQLNDALDTLGLGDASPERFRALMLEEDVALAVRRYDRVGELLARMDVVAGDDPVRLGAIAHRRGRVARDRGDLEPARAWFVEAARLRAIAGDLHGLANAHLDLARIEARRGRLAQASAELDRCEAVAHDNGDDAMGIRVIEYRGQLARMRGDFDAAEAAFAAVLPRALRLGHASVAAQCRLGLAEIARYRGDLSAAAAGYAEVVAERRAIGADTTAARLNLALVANAGARWADARAILDGLVPELEAAGVRPFLGAALVTSLPCLAGLGDWEAWDEAASRAVALLDETAMVDRDIAGSAELAGRLATDAGETGRAKVAGAIASRQWDALRPGAG